MKCFLPWLAALTVASIFPGVALCDEYPSKPVRVVVPYPAAGGVDILARTVAERLAARWHQPVVVENKSGAGTIIGAEFVARSAPDGYTLLLTTDATITSNPHTHAKLPHDPMKDFAPITLLIVGPQLVVVHASVAASSMNELAALAKRQPGALNYASYGNGSQPHLLFEAFKVKTGAPISHIPYRGAAPGLQAVVAGEVHLALVPLALSRPFIQAGRLKPIAIGRAERARELPDLPTLGEAGFSDIYPLTWFGLFAPAGTPRPIVLKVQADVAAIFSDPEFRERHILQRGYDPAVGTPEEFAAFIRSDHAAKGQLIKRAGLRPE